MSKGNANQQLGGPALPQVNLLPPEVKAARNLSKVKAWLGVALVATLALALLAYGYAMLQASGAADELTSARAEGAKLVQEQAKYAEVPKVLGALSDAKTARTVGMSTEVAWKGYLDAIAAELPAEVSIDTLEVKGITPLVAAPAPKNVLQAPSLYTIHFTGRSLKVVDTAALMDGLNSIPAFADAWVSAVTITAQDKTVYYELDGSVQVNDLALANRFAAKKGAN